MVNQTSSIVAALFARAMSLRVLARELGDAVLRTDCDFTRSRLEVVARQAMDAQASYEAARAVVVPVVRPDRFVQEDSHVLDYVINRLG
jgi:hypothetical protein